MATAAWTKHSFPKDLITEILVRLPVKTLLRFRAVSKPWLSLISSPNFINSHIRQAITSSKSDETLVISKDGVSVSLVPHSSCLTGTIPEVSDSRGDFSSIPEPEILIVGSCNGIVCASIINPNGVDFFDRLKNRKTTLLNPATKHYKLIPPHNISNNIMVVSFGFGFDPIGNDFKTVRVIKQYDEPFCAEVYSVNRDAWKRVEPRPTDHPDGIVFDVCVRGVLCCTGLYGVMAFDLNKEVFKCGIKFPPIKRYDPCLTEYKGLLALIDYSWNDESNSKISLWTLDDACLRGAVEESWTLMFSFDVGFTVDWVHGCLNRGDILLRNEDAAWFLCNPDNKESKAIQFPKFRGKLFNHIESLVSIRGSKQVKTQV